MHIALFVLLEYDAGCFYHTTLYHTAAFLNLLLFYLLYITLDYVEC
jgi:hypothetical protein